MGIKHGPSLSVEVEAAARNHRQEQHAADHQHHDALHPVLVRRQPEVEGAGGEGERDFMRVVAAPQRQVCQAEVAGRVVRGQTSVRARAALAQQNFRGRPEASATAGRRRLPTG
eukprot:558898-Hanusia_phi.AAC.2